MMIKQPSQPIKTAVITGGHAFDVPNFHLLFRNLEGIDAYIQHIDDFSSSPQEVRDRYDVVLFYIMMIEGPKEEGLPWYAGHPKTALEHLGETKQGIFLLHHTLLAYPQWPVWDELVGIRNRGTFGFSFGETVHTEITGSSHPITQDLCGWDMVDETYTMGEAGPDSNVLLTIDHPKSVKTIAWTRVYKNAPVFCYQAGHDNQTWLNSNFRQVLRNGICWCAGRI